MNQNDKLIRIAKGFYKDFMDSESPSDVYAKFSKIAHKQKEYFIDYLGYQNILKIVIYIWSLCRTGNSKLGDRILNNLIFSVLLNTDLEHPLVTCPNCKGNGELKCGYCMGNGQVSCTECGGTSLVQCDKCDGDGELEFSDGEIIGCASCGGEGDVECPEGCDDGYVDCDECNNGKTICDDCEGDGEIQDEESTIYEVTYLISWDKELNEILENQQSDGLMNQGELSTYNQKYIITHMETEIYEGTLDLFSENYYLIEITDDPFLYGTTFGKFKWYYHKNNIDNL